MRAQVATRQKTIQPPIFTAAAPTKAKSKAKSCARELSPREERRRKNEELAAKHPDTKLIQLCVAFGSLIAAANQAYRCDPTDAAFADAIDLASYRKAYARLGQAAPLHALSVDGLRAKAEVFRLILRQSEGSGSSLEESEVQFAVGLIEDIKRFHQLLGLRGGSVPFAKAEPSASREKIIAEVMAKLNAPSPTA